MTPDQPAETGVPAPKKTRHPEQTPTVLPLFATTPIHPPTSSHRLIFQEPWRSGARGLQPLRPGPRGRRRRSLRRSGRRSGRRGCDGADVEWEGPGASESRLEGTAEVAPSELLEGGGDSDVIMMIKCWVKKELERVEDWNGIPVGFRTTFAERLPPFALSCRLVSSTMIAPDHPCMEYAYIDPSNHPNVVI